MGTQMKYVANTQKLSSARSRQLRSQSRRLGMNRSRTRHNGIGRTTRIDTSSAGSIQVVVTALTARMVQPKTKTGWGSDQSENSSDLCFIGILLRTHGIWGSIIQSGDTGQLQALLPAC